ncbi:MAG: FHA domain-containing protein [Anaerolineales bacterium]|jgi:pSer/pThr/pTyr-binding forkhead associated (FHA) protein|uniref:FHA domain-containing protein n=1 Tax=Candidatus Villigracilis vicinus TaxID=3140679 RepID=UPI0031362DA4|nr:FHA domain-containing protein [Anaerolineales bacterium]
MSGSVVLVLRVATALTLYGFLGWALVFFYREIQRQGINLTSRRVPGISITVRSAGTQSTMRYFSQAEISIGRDPGCDIPIFDETISARHAQLTYHHNQWWLEDLTSTNGTRLNAARITTPTVITSGDEIQCGGTNLSISLSENVIIEPTQRLGKRTPPNTP